MSKHLNHDAIQEYYGKVLKTHQDLQTSACCTGESVPAHLRALLRDLHPEVKEKFYGCGSPIPSCLEGTTVLDLGSGSGRDCFLLSRLVGEAGRVIGVDMTEEQLAVANRHVDYHTRQFGYSSPNVSFRKGYIEDLEALGIASDSIDVVVSNCVLNLSPDKERVFKEIWRVLKPGGELYFSDVFADRRVPPALTRDPLLLGECLGGALYLEDFRRLMARIGCPDYRVVTSNPITLNNPEIERKAGMIGFFSVTVRAFKLELEDRCEDYGQVAYYLGTIAESPHAFRLDDHHLLQTGRPMPVCGNTADMLAGTRYGQHFRIAGDTSTHYGLFACGSSLVLSQNSGKDPAAGSCC